MSAATLIKIILPFLAKHGFTAGIVNKIPLNTVGKVLRDAVPESLVAQRKGNFIVVEGEKNIL